MVENDFTYPTILISKEIFNDPSNIPAKYNEANRPTIIDEPLLFLISKENMIKDITTIDKKKNFI